MKVYFSGAHSSGKSTCARYASEKHNLSLLTEVPRMVLSERELQVDTLRYDMDLVNDYQLQVFNRQLEEENKYIDFVADRSAIDCLAYVGQHTDILPQIINSPQLQSYIYSLKSPDTIIFLVRPTTATLKNDGVRETISWDGIVAIDGMIKLLYEMWGIRYFSIHSSSMQERVKLIDAVLSLKTIA